jgi:hypothetical protein
MLATEPERLGLAAGGAVPVARGPDPPPLPDEGLPPDDVPLLVPLPPVPPLAALLAEVEPPVLAPVAIEPPELEPPEDELSVTLVPLPLAELEVS